MATSESREDTAGPAAPVPARRDPSGDGIQPSIPAEEPPPPERGAGWLKRLLIGRPRDLADRRIHHHLSLIPFLAWVGMGADGLSSSAYGPEESYLALGEHTYLAVGLALAVALTVGIISLAYIRIIEQFPHGGGGYVVATKLLGRPVGVVAGCALLVDYVLTITISIAAAGEALFSILPLSLHTAKLPFEILAIVGLIVLNLRGVRESVLVLTPIFIAFLLTHALLLGIGIGRHAAEVPAVAHSIGHGFSQGLGALGLIGMLGLFVHAYSLGGGTYTGIEAVSNGLPLLREPRVQTGRRTMIYMATSLAITAAGLLLCYLLVGVQHIPGKTLNAVLVERVTAGWPGPAGWVFVVITLLTEGALLVVAAQGGFIGGPRVLANMAIDWWVPRWFAALSDRLTTQNGIMLMGSASLVALFYTRGNVHHLVVMYSINVFLTFSLSMLGMLRARWQARLTDPEWMRRARLFAVGFVLCTTILVITTYEKFGHGGWVTLLVTGAFIAVCFMIQRHYQTVAAYLRELDKALVEVRMPPPKTLPPLDPSQPTGAVLVAGYGGLGIHTTLNIFRSFPGYFKNLVFVSVGVIDSGEFKGEQEMDALRKRTEESLQKYVELAAKFGMPATGRYAIGTEAVAEAETLCLSLRKEFPRITIFAGQVIFAQEKWYQRLLHNQTAFAIQKRLQWDGMTMVILPVRVR